MTSQQRIQDYLKRHKIGALFEELMGRLVIDLPDDPHRYLSKMIKDKSDQKKEKSQMSKSISGPVLAKAKASSPNMMRKTVNYMEGSPTVRKSKGKPEWDYHTKVPAASFDEMWDDGAGRKSVQPVNVGGNSNSIWTTFATNDKPKELDQMVGLAATRMMNKGRVQTEEDDLANEMVSSKRKTVNVVFSEQTKPQQTSCHKKGRKADVAKHRKELKEMALKKDVQHDSGIEEDRNFVRDDANELYEDADDLQGEGVRNVKQSGNVIKRSTKPAAEPQVVVKICARCARFLTGDIADNSNYPSGNYENESSDAENLGIPSFGSRNFVPDPVNSARFTPSRGSARSPGPFESDDEEFESVSQVSGPRRPVWNENDAGVSRGTPRMSTHKTSDAYNASRNRSSTTARSATNQPRSSAQAFRRSSVSDVGQKGATPRADKQDDTGPAVSSLKQSSTQWQVVDYDTDDSTAYVTGESKSKNNTYKPRVY